MKKIIIPVVVVALLAVAGSLLLGKLDSFVAKTIETEGTKALGVPVKVSGVKLDLKQGLAGFSGLTIANPKGYTEPYAIQINDFSAEVDYSTQEIAAIIIDEPIITAEVKGESNNFQDLVNNMPQSQAAEENAEEGGESPEISIKLIKISGATVRVISDKSDEEEKSNDEENSNEEEESGDQEFVMSTLIIRNLKGTPDVIAKAISARLTSHVIGEIAGYMIKSKVQDKVNEALKDGLGEKFEKLGGFKF